MSIRNLFIASVFLALPAAAQAETGRVIGDSIGVGVYMGAQAARAEDLREPLIAALRGGDVVMIKGSNGSRMGPLAAALREHFSPVQPGARL